MHLSYAWSFELKVCTIRFLLFAYMRFYLEFALKDSRRGESDFRFESWPRDLNNFQKDLTFRLDRISHLPITGLQRACLYVSERVGSIC